MSSSTWLHAKAMTLFDWLDSPHARAPMTVALVLLGFGLILSERRADRKARR